MEIQRSSDGASSSSTAAVDKYDVFINHRGEVKKNFAGHLYRALLSGGLRPFLDQQDLQEGLPFPSQLEAVIRNASVHVAVFSPKYAESRWCLDELLLMRQSGAPIIPVFYHVNPADLRWTDQNKTGVYATSLHELEMKKTSDPQTREEKLRYDPATIQNWRDALSFVADITGFDLNGKFNGDEVHMIDKIVECVGKVIRKPGLYVAKHPTGLNDKVTDFEATVLKQQQAGKIQVAGIVGLGGMGKTTLALELFNRMSSKYNKSFFLSDVREKANKTSLHSVQRELLRGLTEREVDINSIYEGIGMFEKHLQFAHVLLILDDIDHENQLEALLPVKDVLRPDSFILITSRYKDVLERSGVEELCIYKLTGLPRQHSQQLFCSYAFRQTNPLHGFENLVDQFLQVCDGLPLALKVLGALLFGKPESYWDAELFKLKVQMQVSTDIKDRLKISYDALSEEEQKIFLDIALFFIGESKTSAIAVWDASGWNGLVGLTNLEGKCLVEVDDKNVIRMHDQLRDLGRQIAEEETPRRLWRPTGDIDEWLHKYSSVLTEARGFWLLAEGHSTKRVGNHVFLKLRNWLQNKCYRFLGRDVMNFQLVETEGHLLDRILRVHSPNLSWLSWRHCPYTCLPSWITIKNLRVLKVEGAVLKTLWQGISQAPLALQELEIINARCLSSIPKSIGQLKHLERIVIVSYSLAKLPEEFSHMNSLKSLELHAYSLKALPNSFGKLRNLHHMDLSGCLKLEKLPDSFGSLSNLHSLDLTSCSQLERLPDSFGSLSNLHSLDLTLCSQLERLPDSFGSLSNLHSLYLTACSQLERLPDSFSSLSNLHSLRLDECHDLERLPDSFGSLSNLHSLDLSKCHRLERLPDSFGSLPKLHSLDLSFCTNLERLPDSFGSLTNLGSLDLSLCPNLERLPDSFGSLTNLHSLGLNECSQLERLPDSFGGLTNLHSFTCTQLERLPDSFGRLTNLHSLALNECHLLERLPDSFGSLMNLHSLDLSLCTELERLPDSFGNLTNLHSLRLTECYKLERLPDSFGSLSKLHSLNLLGCPQLERLPDSLGSFTNLHSLDLSLCTQLERLPDSFGSLRNLHRLELGWCTQLESLPDSFGSLSSLKYFGAESCSNLRISSKTFGNIRTLEHIDLSSCEKVEVWPWQLGHQRSLKVVKLTGTNLKNELLDRVIAELPSDLEVLWIGNPLLDRVMPSLGHLRKLKELRLECINLRSIEGLCGLPTLRELHIEKCNELEELLSVETMVSLQRLYAIDCAKLKSIRDLAHLTKLEHLEVRRCRQLGEMGGVEDCTSLRDLSVEECPKLQWDERVVERLRQQCFLGFELEEPNRSWNESVSRETKTEACTIVI